MAVDDPGEGEGQVLNGRGEHHTRGVWGVRGGVRRCRVRGVRRCRVRVG